MTLKQIALISLFLIVGLNKKQEVLNEKNIGLNSYVFYGNTADGNLKLKILIHDTSDVAFVYYTKKDQKEIKEEYKIIDIENSSFYYDDKPFKELSFVNKDIEFSIKLINDDWKNIPCFTEDGAYREKICDISCDAYRFTSELTVKYKNKITEKSIMNFKLEINIALGDIYSNCD